MPLACKILIDEFRQGQVQLESSIKDIIYKHLQYNIKNGNNLAVVWLVYLLVNVRYSFDKEFVRYLIKTGNELAIIILLEEQSWMFDVQLVNECWDQSDCWLMLYQIALRFADKRELYFEKLQINNNRDFYNKLFNNEFSFYKRIGAYYQ